MESKQENIRRLAEQTMYELKNTRNGPTEMYALLKQHYFFEIRRWMAYWIGKLNLENAREVLQYAAISDSDQRVRQEASEALKQLPAAK